MKEKITFGRYHTTIITVVGKIIRIFARSKYHSILYLIKKQKNSNFTLEKPSRHHLHHTHFWSILAKNV